VVLCPRAQLCAGQLQAVIEKKLDYWYKKFHGAMDGLDEIKTQAAATVFLRDL
jgi:hypothetical protein